MKEEGSNKDQSFWTTMPGILTGCAAMITAIGGLLAVLYTAGVLQPPTPAPSLNPPIRSMTE